MVFQVKHTIRHNDRFLINTYGTSFAQEMVTLGINPLLLISISLKVHFVTNKLTEIHTINKIHVLYKSLFKPNKVKQTILN